MYDLENRELLIAGIEKYGVSLNENQVEQFFLYMRLLQKWNEKINLTAITENEGIIKKHFIDSASMLESGVLSKEKSLIDVGTGAGFPGIPLKIIIPELRLTLLDSLNKRVKFLDTVVNELGLTGVTLIHGRAEEMSLKKEHREKYDLATARAVAGLNILCEYCLPYVRRGGYFVAMKGPSGYGELQSCSSAIRMLGGADAKILEVEIMEEDLKHNLVLVHKVEATAAKYPRRFAIMEKNPL